MSEKISPDQVDSLKSQADSQNHGDGTESAAAVSVREDISALMDGEASDLELRRILKQSAEDSAAATELQDVWRRYHMLSDTLHHDIHTNPATNLLPGIQAKLAQEQIDHSRVVFGRSMGGIMRRLGQTAIAASVAFTVLYSGTYLQTAVQSGSVEDASIASNSSTLPELGGEFNPSTLSRTVSMDDAARQRIRRAVSQFSVNQQGQSGTAYTFPLDDKALDAEIEPDADRSANNSQ